MSYPPNSNAYPPPPMQQGTAPYPPPNQGGFPQPGYGQTYGGAAPYDANVVHQQPDQGMGNQLMSRPANCPPGLEYLTQVNQLLVKQTVELLEAFTGFETNNKYKIKNALGQDVYLAKEDTDCCTRQCCGPIRPFDMNIVDNTGHEVIHLTRPLRCQSCCFPCCLQVLEVHSPPGTIIGTVEQEWSILTPQFSIKDATGATILRIEGPFCTWSICGDVEFNVLTASGQEVGKISKQWSGFAKEAFTDADNFGISFPMDLDVKVKATLLGAVFLIDFMFFEKSGNNENDNPGMF